MRSEPDVSGHDAEVLKAVVDDHKILNKALVEIFDRDPSSVSRYMNGERTIPVRCIRNLFEATHDMRLVALVTGSVPFNFTLITVEIAGSKSAPNIPPMSELLPRTLESIRQAATGAERMAKIVSDNRVDASDQLELRDFRKAANAARENLAICLAALDAYERGIGGAK